MVVSGLTLAALMFGSLAEINGKKRPETEQFFLNIKLEIMSYYGNWLLEIGSEPKHAKLWKGLIEMRMKEYVTNKDKYLKNEDMKNSNIWQHIVAIGGFTHITRGKGKPEDQLL